VHIRKVGQACCIGCALLLFLLLPAVPMIMPLFRLLLPAMPKLPLIWCLLPAMPKLPLFRLLLPAMPMMMALLDSQDRPHLLGCRRRGGGGHVGAGHERPILRSNVLARAAAAAAHDARAVAAVSHLRAQHTSRTAPVVDARVGAAAMHRMPCAHPASERRVIAVCARAHVHAICASRRSPPGCSVHSQAPRAGC